MPWPDDDEYDLKDDWDEDEDTETGECGDSNDYNL